MIIYDKAEFDRIVSSGALIGIDFGWKKIGIAITDKERIISSPLKILQNDEKLLLNLEEIIKEYRIVAMIIGIIPNAQIENDITNFANIIADKFHLPILFMDESFSTRSAQINSIFIGEFAKANLKFARNSQSSQKVSQKNKKTSLSKINYKNDDHLAANEILKMYLSY